MNLKEVKERLKVELVGMDARGKLCGKSPREIARALVARPLIDNPEPAPQVLLPFSADDVRAIVPLVGLNDEGRLFEIVRNQDHEGLALWAELFGDDPHVDAVVALARRTGPDPAHPALVKGASRLEALGIDEIEWRGTTIRGGCPRELIAECLDEMQAEPREEVPRG